MINIVFRNDGAIRIGFLAVHYMVLCLALHLIEPVIREQLELSFDAAYELARRMYSAAQVHFKPSTPFPCLLTLCRTI
jgi:hypothetical protein